VDAAGVTPGADGGLYPRELFETEAADVVVFLPVPVAIPAGSRARMIEVPAAELAVAVHRGPSADLDQTYAAVDLHSPNANSASRADPRVLPRHRRRHPRRVPAPHRSLLAHLPNCRVITPGRPHLIDPLPRGISVSRFPAAGA
jgi:hypothetical protein